MGQPRFNDVCEQIFTCAKDLSKKGGLGHVNSMVLAVALVSVVQVRRSVCNSVLMEFGCSTPGFVELIRNAVVGRTHKIMEAILPNAFPPDFLPWRTDLTDLPWTPVTMKLQRVAQNIAAIMKSDLVLPEHLALGILCTSSSVISMIRDYGIPPTKLKMSFVKSLGWTSMDSFEEDVSRFMIFSV